MLQFERQIIFKTNFGQLYVTSAAPDGFIATQAREPVGKIFNNFAEDPETYMEIGGQKNLLPTADHYKTNGYTYLNQYENYNLTLHLCKESFRFVISLRGAELTQANSCRWSLKPLQRL